MFLMFLGQYEIMATSHITRDKNRELGRLLLRGATKDDALRTAGM